MTRHLPILCFLLALTLYIPVSLAYPGGSDADRLAEGYSWYQNYFCNLMAPTAVNGAANPLFWLARLGVAAYAAGVACFYYYHSQKVADKTSARVIRYAGIGSMVSQSFIFTYHELFNIPAIILSFLALFYIIVNLFKERVYVFAWFGAICLLLLYAAVYIYYSGQFIFLLTAAQKVVLLGLLTWILTLHYLYKPTTT